MKKDMYSWLLIARGLKDRGMLTKENGQYVAKPEMGQLVLFPQLEKKEDL